MPFRLVPVSFIDPVLQSGKPRNYEAFSRRKAFLKRLNIAGSAGFDETGRENPRWPVVPGRGLPGGGQPVYIRPAFFGSHIEAIEGEISDAKG